MNTYVRQQMTQEGRIAAGLLLLDTNGFTSLKSMAQEMATATDNRETTKARKAVAFFTRHAVVLCPTSVVSINGHEPGRTPSGSDWKCGHRIRGGIPLVANG